MYASLVEEALRLAGAAVRPTAGAGRTAAHGLDCALLTGVEPECAAQAG